MKPGLLILTFTYPPNKDGVANAAALVAEGLAARGHEVQVGTIWHPERPLPQPDDNPRVHQFKVQGSASLRDPISGETAEMTRYISAFEGDMIFCHTLERAPTVLAMRTFSKLAASKVMVSHGYSPHLVGWHRKFPWGLAQWLARQPFVWQLPWILRRFDRLVFLSGQRDFGRFLDHRVARFIGHRGIRIIPNAADLKEPPETLPDFRRIHGLEGRCLFLCVANYSDGKNQLGALAAYRRARIPNSAQVFIGSELNDYASAMQALDARLAPAFPDGRVLLLEKQPRPMTEAAIRSMDAFVLPTRQETQPIVLLETMAAGRPFIATPKGCIPELAGGVIARDEEELVGALQRLAGDAELRSRLGAEARRDYDAKYRKEAVLEAYENLIRDVREERSNPAP
jgi:glycosyltransferase involved in cell wall biosynthesis